MTWEVKDGALVCSAHGLESVVCPASPSSPFNTWGCFREVRRSSLGGVFLSPAYRQVLFVPTAPFPADTRAALSQDGEGRQVLAFSTEGEGLRHAWRVDRGSWQATEQAEAVVGVLSPGPHLVEVYAFDTQLSADTTPASFSIGAAPEAAEEAPVATAFPLEVAEVVSAPLVAPDGGVYVLARNEARETLLRRWDGKEWREQPAGGAPEQPDTPPADLFIPSRVEPDELALADDGRVWAYEGGFPQRGFIISFADGAREYFPFLRERLEDPAARPASFRPAEGRHTAPVLCPDGRVALRMGLRLFCLENGAWRGFRLDTLDKRPVFAWEPFPLGVDEQGRLRVEKAGVCFTLAAGAAAFEPCVPLPEPSERGTRPEQVTPPPPGPCLDTFGMAWRVGDRGLVCALGEEELVVIPPGESLPFLGQEDLELVLRPPCGGVLALARTGKLAVFPPSGDAPATAARAEARDNAVIQLAMTTPGEGVRHVWRVDGGPWALAQGPEAETPPLPPGTHTVEVCAFSGLMSADPTPERFSLEIAPQNDIATLSAALAAGGARGLWALDQLKSMGAEGLALAKARLAATTDPGERWALEAAVQRLEEAASAEEAPTGQP
ncbi:MAG TPA: hypothetical protein PKL54_05610 [Candidatus Hydrogenedentes bacterium]|nr:hypothetical protein [Candidatus Hydrogenedentota bacterium]